MRDAIWAATYAAAWLNPTSEVPGAPSDETRARFAIIQANRAVKAWQATRERVTVIGARPKDTE